MTVYLFKSADRGVVFRPQNFRIYHAAVQAKASGWPGWGRETPQGHWEPLQLEWAANGKLSTLTLRRVLGAGDNEGSKRPERLLVSAGDRYRLIEAGSRGRRDEVFRGYVGQGSLTIQANPDFECASVVVYGPEILLEAHAVTGAWYMSPQADDAEILGSATDESRVRSSVLATNLPVIFNEAGQPNASDANWALTDNVRGDPQCAVFTAPGRVVQDSNGKATVQASHWNAYTAVRSLLEWYDHSQVISHSVTDWQAITQIASVPIGEVNVTGMNLLEAVRAILGPVGLGFALEPWASHDGKHRLYVFALHGATRRVGPFLGDRQDSVSVASRRGQRCNIQRLDFTRDNHRTANDVLVVGDRKRREVELEFSGAGAGDLAPYWDTTEDDLSDYADGGIVAWRNWSDQQYRTFSDSYTYGFETCRKHAFRSFAWNEDGALAPIIDQIPDLSEYGVGGLAVRRPRPVGDRFSFGNFGRALPVAVQFGISGSDDSWIQVPAYIWPDRAGFTLTRRTLHDWYPYADEYCRGAGSDGTSLWERYGHLSYLSLLYNALQASGTYRLRLRLMGSVELDECVTGRAAYSQDSSWPFRSEKVVFSPNRFKWHGTGDDDGDTVDDSQSANHYSARVQDVLEDATGHGSILLRGIDRSYQVGDAIAATRGRVVNLRIGGRGIDDAVSFAPVVIGIVWNFEAGIAKTELILESPLLKVTR